MRRYIFAEEKRFAFVLFFCHFEFSGFSNSHRCLQYKTHIEKKKVFVVSLRVLIRTVERTVQDIRSFEVYRLVQRSRESETSHENVGTAVAIL